MTKIRYAVATIVVLAAAGSVMAQDKKPAPPAAAPAAKPAAAPAAAPSAAAPAGAPAAGAPPMPQPSKELAEFMKPFEGSWKCETKFPANAMGPGSPEVMAKSTVKFKKDFDGFFYRGEYEVKKQKGVPMAMKGLFFTGWDPGSKQLIVSGIDSFGSAWMSTGKIEGQTASYSGEGYMMGMKVKTKETMGSKGPKEGFHTFMVDMGKGFMPFGEDNCKK